RGGADRRVALHRPRVLVPNWNLLQTNPLGVVLAALLLPMVVRGRPSAAATLLALAIGALSLLGLLVHLLAAQRNGDILAFTVPLNLGLAAALLRVHRPGGRAAS